MNELLLAVPVIAAIASQIGVGYGRSRCGHEPVELPEPVAYDRPIIREPWRDSHPDALTLPIGLLLAFAKPETLAWQRLHDQEIHAKIRAEILADGQREPLELIVDGAGRGFLSDGNHRLVILRDLGWPTTGVTIKTSPKLKWGRPLYLLFTDPDLAATLRWR